MAIKPAIKPVISECIDVCVHPEDDINGNGLLSGLIAFWSLSEFSDGLTPVTRVDSHSNGYDLTDSGSVASEGDAARFNDASDTLSRTDDFGVSGGSSWSVGFWIKITTAGAPSSVIVGFGEDVSEWVPGFVHSNSGVAGPDSENTRPRTDPITAGQWAFVVGVYDYDAGVIKIYHNAGEPGFHDEESYDETDFEGSISLVVGGISQDVELKRLAMWDRAITAADVVAMYNSGSGLDYSDLTA